MLDALAALAGGRRPPAVPRRQRLLLGDDASIPIGPHLAEVRRGHQRHAGLVVAAGRVAPPDDRRAGRPVALPRPRTRTELVGVGFAAQADSTENAAGYRRTAASLRPAHAWIFDGVSDDGR